MESIWANKTHRNFIELKTVLFVLFFRVFPHQRSSYVKSATSVLKSGSVSVRQLRKKWPFPWQPVKRPISASVNSCGNRICRLLWKPYVFRNLPDKWEPTLKSMHSIPINWFFWTRKLKVKFQRWNGFFLKYRSNNWKAFFFNQLNLPTKTFNNLRLLCFAKWGAR